jgi:hypothetical protein
MDVHGAGAPRAWLLSRTGQAETYVGNWLQPVLAGDRMLGPVDTVEQRAHHAPVIRVRARGARPRRLVTQVIAGSCQGSRRCPVQEATHRDRSQTMKHRIVVLIQFVTADDRAKPSLLTGRLAARYKELVCKGVVHPMLMLPTRHHRVRPEPPRPW